MAIKYLCLVKNDDGEPCTHDATYLVQLWGWSFEPVCETHWEEYQTTAFDGKEYRAI